MGKQGCVSLSPGTMQQGSDGAGEEERVREGQPPPGQRVGTEGSISIGVGHPDGQQRRTGP